jgi:hypothetical protein
VVGWLTSEVSELQKQRDIQHGLLRKLDYRTKPVGTLSRRIRAVEDAQAATDAEVSRHSFFINGFATGGLFAVAALGAIAPIAVHAPLAVSSLGVVAAMAAVLLGSLVLAGKLRGRVRWAVGGGLLTAGADLAVLADAALRALNH